MFFIQSNQQKSDKKKRKKLKYNKSLSLIFRKKDFIKKVHEYDDQNGLFDYSECCVGIIDACEGNLSYEEIIFEGKIKDRCDRKIIMNHYDTIICNENLLRPIWKKQLFIHAVNRSLYSTVFGVGNHLHL